MLGQPDTPSSDQDSQTRSTSAFGGLEVGALLTAVTALHLDGLLTDAEYRAKRQRLIARF